jgi:hypothetical protein
VGGSGDPHMMPPPGTAEEPHPMLPEPLTPKTDEISL